MVNCPSCGKQISEDVAFCPYCGADVKSLKATVKPAQENVTPNTSYHPHSYGNQGQVIAALVLGIVSVVCGFIGIFVAAFIMGIIGLVTGIIGLVFAVKNFRYGNRSSLTIAALVTAIVGLVLSAIMFIIGLIALITAAAILA